MWALDEVGSNPPELAVAFFMASSALAAAAVHLLSEAYREPDGRKLAPLEVMQLIAEQFEASGYGY